jgi:hypothetical protein
VKPLSESRTKLLTLFVHITLYPNLLDKYREVGIADENFGEIRLHFHSALLEF